jgi:hypothetical protein
MDPISQSSFPMNDLPAYEPPVPQPPDASDIQEFQSLYRQDVITLGEPSRLDGFQGMLANMIGGALPASPSDNIFTAAMSRMAEQHEKDVSKLETLVERITSGSGMTPAQMIEAQVIVAEATQGLSTYQAVDKKIQEGVKALMTGQ